MKTNNNIIIILINVVMAVLLVAAAIKDIREQTIDGKLLIALLIGSMSVIGVSEEINIASSLCAMAIVFILLSFIYYVSKKSIGWGDVLLCTCTAPYLGVEKAFTMLFISMLLCGLFAWILLLISKKNKSVKIPFVPFAAIGTIAALML